MGNINRHLTQADLEHVFAPLGAFQLLKHKKGESKGWGFLCFANSATANRGRTFLLSAKFMIRGLTLDVGTVRTWGTTNESLARNMGEKHDHLPSAANDVAANPNEPPAGLTLHISPWFRESLLTN